MSMQLAPLQYPLLQYLAHSVLSYGAHLNHQVAGFFILQDISILVIASDGSSVCSEFLLITEVSDFECF